MSSLLGNRVRAAVAVTLAAGMSALAAPILGEYEITLSTGFVAGVVVGLVVAEIVVSGTRWRGPMPVVVAVGLAVASLGWAGWIDAGEGLEPYPTGGWIAVATGGVVAAARASGIGTAGRAEDGP